MMHDARCGRARAKKRAMTCCFSVNIISTLVDLLDVRMRVGWTVGDEASIDVAIGMTMGANTVVH